MSLYEAHTIHLSTSSYFSPPARALNTMRNSSHMDAMSASSTIWKVDILWRPAGGCTMLDQDAGLNPRTPSQHSNALTLRKLGVMSPNVNPVNFKLPVGKITQEVFLHFILFCATNTFDSYTKD